MDRVAVLVVGAGQAGAMAAAALRGHGFTGRIQVVGAEQAPPYERPPLSKALLAGPGTIADALVHPPGFYDQGGIEMSLGVQVESLDTGARVARLSTGGAIAYEQCLVATGGRARTVEGLAPGTPRVHYLRSAADALRLREELQQHRRLLVVGGGFLGLEVASTARDLGLEVTVVEGAGRLLARALPPAASEWLQARVRNAGVVLRLDTRCAAYDVSPDGVVAHLEGGDTVPADLVVVAVGLEPEVGLAARAGIAIDPANGGIRVDARCATSAPGVFAAGDCASQFHPHAGREIRLESWQNANEQARLAAAAMAGQPAEGLKAPWFWTDQFGVNLQVLGFPAPDLVYHVRGGMHAPDAAPKFLLLGAGADGAIAHAIAFNAGGDLRPVRNLVDARTPCNVALLCDPAVPLKQAVKAATQNPLITPTSESISHA